MDGVSLMDNELPLSGAGDDSARDNEIWSRLTSDPVDSGWASILPGGVRNGVLAAIDSVEGSSGGVESVGAERCGLLYWWPEEFSRRDNGWVVRLKSYEVPNVADGGNFEIEGHWGISLLTMVEMQIERLLKEADVVRSTAVNAAVPEVFFGSWHTHPSGDTSLSPQDLLGEKEFEEWRGFYGCFPLGRPSSFLLALDPDGDVRSVVRYSQHGPMLEWTKQN